MPFKKYTSAGTLLRNTGKKNGRERQGFLFMGGVNELNIAAAAEKT